MNRFQKHISILSAICCVFLGITVMMGWYIYDVRLIQIRPELVPMQYNTALGFLLSGLGLLGLIFNKIKGAQICGGIITCLGFLTLIEYSFDINLHIDELFMEHNIMVGTSHPGRMAPNTALCFTLSGLILLFICSPRIPFEVPNLISILIVTLGLIAFMGYLTDLESGYGWGSLTRMALHSTAGFLILGIGLVAITWQSAMSKHGLPIATGLSILLLTLALWQTLATREKQHIQKILSQVTENINENIIFEFKAQTQVLKRMGNRWEINKPTRAIWEADAQAYINDMPSYQAIEWIDSTFIVRWIVPLQGNEAALNLNLAFEEKRRDALVQAQNQKVIILSEPVDLVQGGKGFLVHVPLYPKDQFDGFIVGVFRTTPFIKKSITPNILSQYHIQISSNNQAFYTSSPIEAFEQQWVQHKELHFENLHWHIQVYPKNVWQLGSFIPELALGAGLFMSVLFSITVLFAQQSFRRTQELDLLNTQLQKNEARFRILTSNAPVGIYELDVHGNGLFFNERWHTITGLTREEAENRGWVTAVHPEDKEDVKKAWQWSIEAGLEFKKEFRFLKPTGQSVWVASSVIRLTNEQNETAGYIGTITDITNQKLAEEALQLNRQELNRQVNNQTALIEINRAVQLVRHPNDLQKVTQICAKQLQNMDIEFDSFSINRLLNAEEDIFEIHTLKDNTYNKDVLSRPGIYNDFQEGNILYRKDVLSPQYQDGLPKNYIQNHTIAGVLDTRSILHIPFDKGTIALRHREPYAFSDEDIDFIKNITQIISIGITRVEDLTQIENSRLELTVSNLELDVTNQIVEAINANLEFEQIYQVFVDKIQALFDFDETKLWVAENDNTYVRYLTHNSPLTQQAPRIKKGDISKSEDFGHVLLTGETFIQANWSESNRFPVPQDLFELGFRSHVILPLTYHNTVVGAFALISQTPYKYTQKDIDKLAPLMDQLGIAIHNAQLLKNLDLKNTELAQRSQELSRINEELEQFAYVASHDLQEPLRVITNYLQLLEKRYGDNLNEQAQGYIKRVVNGAGRMKNLIQDLLAYSRISTQKTPFQTISLDPILEQIESDLEVAIQETQATITHDPLPDIEADPSQITQLFLNIVSNAIKYKSDQPPQIHITSSETDTHYQFNISDNGIGIDPEFFERIFIIFQRLHGRSEYPGTGIGLAICKKIVEKHQGNIWVEPNVEQGTIFHFTIAKSIASHKEPSLQE